MPAVRRHAAFQQFLCSPYPRLVQCACRSRLTRHLASGLLLLLALSVPVEAAVLRVDATAPGAVPDGTSWATAYRDLPAAMAAASDGDEVWVARGRYTVAQFARPLALYGGFAGTEAQRSERRVRLNETTITGWFMIAAGSEGFRLDGFTVSQGLDVKSTTGILAGNTFRYNVTCQGSPVFANNVFLASPTGLQLGNSKATLVNNTFAFNRTAIYLTGSSDPIITNNLITRNITGVMKYTPSAAAATFRSNCFHENGPSGDVRDLADPVGTDGNVRFDPLLASGNLGDVHLQPGSPCIDAGDDGVILPDDTDMDGEPRRQGEHVDIGADESDGTLWDIKPNVIHVSPDGSDKNDGRTWATAKQNLGAGLSATLPAGEIWVKRGVYGQSTYMNPGTAVCPPFVSLYGGFRGDETQQSERSPRENPTILYWPFVVSSANAPAVLDGFTIRDWDVTPGAAAVISGNVFQGAEFGVRCSGGVTPLIEGNWFIGNRIGISIYQASPRIRNNVFTGCAIGTEGGKPVNCTFIANDIGVSVPTIVRNCLFAFNKEGIGFLTSGGSPVVQHSAFYGNGLNVEGQDIQHGVDGNIVADPLLASADGANFHLQPGSPCRDAGDDTALDTAGHDADGQPRLQGEHVDIGADESDGTLWSVTRGIIRLRYDGNDDNDGLTWDTAKRSVAAAVAALDGRGGEVWVAGGCPSDNAVIPPYVSVYGGFAGAESDRNERDPAVHMSQVSGDLRLATGTSGGVLDGLTLAGSDQPAITCTAGTPTISGCTIRTSRKGIVIINSSPLITGCHIAVTGFDFTAEGAGITTTLSEGTVQDCVLEGPNGSKTTGVSVGLNGNLRLLRNTIHGFGKGVYADFLWQEPFMQGNHIHGNNVGLELYKGSNSTRLPRTANNLFAGNGTGVRVISRSATLTNNTFVRNGTAIEVDSSYFNVDNCLISGNVTGIRCFTNSYAFVNSSCIYGNTSADFVGMTSPVGKDGNIAADPLFLDDTSDFRLRDGSPCIDAGNDAKTVAGWLDMDGKERIRGAHVDMGAYEFVPAVTARDRVLMSLRAAAGLYVPSAADRAFLDADGDGVVTLSDAARLAEGM